MATQSPNLGLTLPIGSENVSRQIINDNNLIIDGAVESNSEALAIVINGDTAPKAITSGQYLFIKNHTTLPTGGYHATANIANGAAVTSSNVAQDADGIANALNGNVANLNSKFTDDSSTTPLISSSTASGTMRYKQIGNMVFFTITVTSTLTTTAVNGMFSGLPGSKEYVHFPAAGGVSGNPYPFFQMRPDGGMRSYASVNGTTYCSGVYFTT